MGNSDIIIFMALLGKLRKKPVLWLFIFSVVYFAIRITRLTSLPVFTDEAIYIRWSQIGAHDASWRFISLTDGKQPLFTWFMMAAIRIFDDPLFAGRFVSVVSGFISMIGMYFLGKEVFKSTRVGIISSFFYLISPFALMYDRMALYDSLVAAFSIWNLYLAVLLVRRVRLDVALIFGLSLGVGMLNKTSAFLSLYLLPATLVLFDWKESGRKKRIITWLALCVLVLVLSQAIYSILRLSPYFYIIAQKNTLFVYPLKEWLTHPFSSLQGNLHGVFDWLIRYLTVPVFIASLGSFLFRDKFQKEKLLFIVWWFAPFFGLALFGKVLYPRFVLFMAMPLLVLCAVVIERVVDFKWATWLKVLLLSTIVLPSVYISYGVINHIQTALVPKSDLGQYVNDWPSGWGTNEVVSYLKDQSKLGPIAVYTEGTFGLFPYALEMYLSDNKNIEIHGVWPPPIKLPADIKASAQKMPTYYITNLTQTPPDWDLLLLGSYQKGNNITQHMRLYKIVLHDK